MTTSLWTTLAGVEYTQGWLDAGGVRTRYLASGAPDRPVLLLLHGFGGHAEAYLRNLGAHAPHFRTVAIDFVGHGYSDRPALAYEIPDYVRHVGAVLDALGAPRAHVSGESLGGWVAASFALAHPERVDRLVLNTMGGATMDLAMLDTVRDKTRAAVREPRRHTRARLEWLVADPASIDDDIVETRTRIYEQPGTVEHLERTLCLYDPQVRRRHLLTDERLAGIGAPTLVLWTTRDPTAAPAVGERVARAIPGARYVLMQDCGHWPQWEDAATFNRLHLDFLLGRPG